MSAPGDDRFDRLRLIRTPHVGPVAYRQLLARFGSARQALEAVLPGLIAALGRASDANAALNRFDDIVAGLPSAINLFRLLEARPALAGNAELVRRAIDNVLRNALRVSAEGQKVSVRVGLDDQAYHVSVVDQGPGVDETLLPSIFEPFVRGEGSGSGAGLGLAIAQRAVAAHHGQIVARNGETGGLSVDVTFPLTARPPAG